MVAVRDLFVYGDLLNEVFNNKGFFLITAVESEYTVDILAINLDRKVIAGCGITMKCYSKDEVPSIEPIGYQRLTDVTRSAVSVEPALACFMLAFGFGIALQSEYIQVWVARSYNYTLQNNVKNGTCFINKSSSESIMEIDIQNESSQWLLYLTTASTLPSLFTTVIIGSLGDTFGRRLPIILSSFGQFQNLCFFVIIALYDLPLVYLIGSTFLQGLMGSYTLFIASCFTYISDITTGDNRTRRILIGECVLFSSTGIAQICAGYIVNKYSFVVAFVIATVIAGIGIVYVAVRCLVPETVIRNGNHDLLSVIKISLHQIVNLTSRKSTIYKRKFYVINFSLLIFFMFASIAIIPVLSIYFLGEPFCFSYKLSGYYTAMLLLSPALGLLLSALVLKRFMDDFWLLQLSVLSSMIFLIVSALARTTTVAFVGAGLGIFKSIFAPTCRSIVSKISSPQEQGAVFGCLGFTESLAFFLCPLILNNIYSATVASIPTLVFWLSAGVCVLPVITIGYLQYSNGIDRIKKVECSTPPELSPEVNMSE